MAVSHITNPMRKDQPVFIKFPESTLRGIVTEVGVGWVRVIGKGTYDGTHFHEWFCVNAPKVKVVPAPSSGL